MSRSMLKSLLMSALMITSSIYAMAGDEWSFYCHRPSLAPLHQQLTGSNGNVILKLAGKGNNSVNGSWRTVRKLPAGNFVAFSSHAQYLGLEEPRRSIVTNLVWLDESGRKVMFTEFPRSEWSPEHKRISFYQIYRVPDKAVAVQIDLIYRWDKNGEVTFEDTKLVSSEPPMARQVTLATIHHRPSRSSTEQNLDAFANLAVKAGAQGADIVCLPEGIDLVGTGLNYVQASESIPGPFTNKLSQIALKHRMYIVAGLIERDGEEIYNTAILINRQGELQGKYRKVSLPREEIEGGIVPGDQFPVFDTDFGKIGMMICWDVTFPEAARALAANGAEIIFLPIWGGNFTLAQARAIENQVYVVSSTYDMKSAILGLEGEILAEATTEDPVALQRVNLNAQKLWPWLGDFKNRIWQEGPPERAIQRE